MKLKLLLLVSLLTLGLISSCDVAESNQTTDIEDAIMKVISADDSTYGIEGMGNIEEEDYTLSKSLVGTQVASGITVLSLRDSNYVWRFGRTGIEVEREITIEVEDDSSALALISHQITGTFHVRQFERVWTGVDSWERGDSVRFSQKPINMTTHRRVAFKKRLDAAGVEQWKPVAMTLLTGHSGESLDIETLEWVAEDSTLILTDFDTVLYDRRHPLLLSQLGANHVNVVLSNNDVEGEAEMVTGRLGYHPRLSGPDARSRFHFHYVESLATGEKVYSQRIIPIRMHPRNFKGFVEVIDYRTLFDHDYPDYTSATLGFIYTTREHVRP
ncbi:MAG: hypothetical protein K9M55_11300 [Candidatus Marinimicrobia bacterium]|nr:hypothetical protein [Candidatus Neomarinimicrobiota bacterium]MCF7923277.1 hypothetical protein [Candidatus Neomarinimicrobiota bacterium]